MEKFKFVDITTADVAFDAYGKTLSEIFSNSALAMFEVMVDTSQIAQNEKREIKANGQDMESLMFNWLNELLVYVDSENLAFSRFDIEVDEKNLRLAAECYGEPIDPKMHETRTVVKAATYHKMEIKNENGIWRARVIIDI